MNEPQTFADLQDAGNAQAQLILQAIARHANWDTGACWPGDAALSRMGKCSTRTVQTYLAKLEADGLISRADRRSDRGTKLAREITLVGYAEWIAALREGGQIARPKSVGKYDQPPESLSGGPPEKTAPTTGKLSSVTTGKQAARQEQSFNIKDKNTNGHSFFSITAREGAKDQGIKFDFKKGQDDRKLERRAEGLGIPVDELIAKVVEHKPRNRPAYFTKLCVEWLSPKLPGLNQQIIRDALWGKANQYQTITQLLCELP